jgi:hypothetical protein
MFSVSYLEDEAVIEASLAGRVTVEEVMVFGEELVDTLEMFGPSSLLLDYSRALNLDDSAQFALRAAKDACLRAGALQIISMSPREVEDNWREAFDPDSIDIGKPLLESVPNHYSAVVALLPDTNPT